MRTKQVTILAKGRDHGKTFLLTEMPADQAERWALRALLAFANAGARLPDGMLDAGMAGIAASLPGLMVQGLRSLAGLRYEDVEPLLDEMMACVQFVPPGTQIAMALLKGGGSQIEEVRTRLTLRYEVLQLHVDFSLADALPTSIPSPQATSA